MRAHAPSGTWQPPSSSRRRARSAVTHARVSASLSAATSFDVSRSSSRVSIPSAPCPTAGSITSAGKISVILIARAQSRHARDRQNNRVEFARGHFPQPRIHVPAQIQHFKIAAKMPQLRLPPQAARPDARSLPEDRFSAAPIARNQAIARVFAPGHCAEMPARRRLRRHILHAVHREIHRRPPAARPRVP